MNTDLKKIVAWGVCGAGFAIIVVLASSLTGDARLYFALTNNISNLFLPGIVGAAIGIAVGFIRSNK